MYTGCTFTKKRTTASVSELFDVHLKTFNTKHH